MGCTARNESHARSASARDAAAPEYSRAACFASCQPQAHHRPLDIRLRPLRISAITAASRAVSRAGRLLCTRAIWWPRKSKPQQLKVLTPSSSCLSASLDA